jgi:hypothetical protein
MFPTIDLCYGNEGEWTKGGQIVACYGCSWRNASLCIANNLVLKYKLLFELRDNGFAGHRSYASTQAKALDRFWWRRLRQDVNENCDRYVVCRRAKARRHTADAPDPLINYNILLNCNFETSSQLSLYLHFHLAIEHRRNRTEQNRTEQSRTYLCMQLDFRRLTATMAHNWMIFFSYLHVSAGFDSVLVVVEHLTLMAHFFPCAEEITAAEWQKSFYKKCTVCMAFRVVCWLATLTRDLSTHSNSHLETLRN